MKLKRIALARGGVPLVTFPQSVFRGSRRKLDAALARFGFVGIMRDGKLAFYVVSARYWMPVNFKDSESIVTVTRRGVPVFHLVPVFLWNACLVILENFTPHGLRRAGKLLSIESPDERAEMLPPETFTAPPAVSPRPLDPKLYVGIDPDGPAFASWEHETKNAGPQSSKRKPPEVKPQPPFNPAAPARQKRKAASGGVKSFYEHAPKLDALAAVMKHVERD